VLEFSRVRVFHNIHPLSRRFYHVRGWGTTNKEEVEHLDIILNKTEKPVLDDMVAFLKSLTVEEQKEINIFMQGIKFAKKRAEKETA